MKIWQLALGFCAGFSAATVIGLTMVVPFFQDMWEMDVSSDYCIPLRGILAEIEATAAEEKSERTLAQLRVLNKRFAPYAVGTPTPHDWWDEIIAATQPATKPSQ